MAGAAATATPKPEQFDLTIDDDMAEAQADMEHVLEEQVQARRGCALIVCTSSRLNQSDESHINRILMMAYNILNANLIFI